MLRPLLRVFVGLAMVLVGVLHFVEPEPFVRIVPAFLPAAYALVYLSGLCEILGGVGLLWSRTRTLASYGLIALYVAVFPANINMAINEIQLSPESSMPVWALWARLPLQLVLIALVYWLGRPDPSKSS